MKAKLISQQIKEWEADVENNNKLEISVQILSDFLMCTHSFFP